MSSGTRLGPYEIVAPIGAGGMGEVYKARDTRLDRAVAIKILPAEFAHNAQFKVRFEREAKTISQLSHPNICALYDVGENYLVMELLEGESLADRLAKGPLPLNDVLKYGGQIAQALGRAHRAGVIHRDLKPGNVMLTKHGAKLLDFGLAKGGGQPPSAVPDATQQKPLTAEGTVLGTFQYMAPEQLAGEEPDARTDIFALGVVLYEMATGRRAFEGKTKTSLVAAILSGEPKPMSELQPLTPRSLEHVVKKSLAKDPDDRWQSASDIAEELRWISEGGSQPEVAMPIAIRRRVRERLAWSIVAVLAVVVAVIASLYWRAASSSPRPMQFSIPLPPNTDTYRFDNLGLAISPDGTRLVLALRTPGIGRQLYIRPLNSALITALPDTRGASLPFWSPDGKFIGFFADGKLKKVAADGGPVQVVCDAPTGRGGTWNRNGDILFAPTPYSGLSIVSSGGGTPRAVTKLNALQDLTHRWPWFLPDGRHFLYMNPMRGVAERGRIFAAAIDSPTPKLILDDASNVVYVGSGWLLFSRGNALMAVRFDARNLRTTGQPVTLPLGKVGFYPDRNQAFFSASDDGSLVFLPPSRPLTQLQWIDRAGKVVGSEEAPGYYISAAISPDGKRIAFTRADPSDFNRSDIWLHDIGTSHTSRFTFEGHYRVVRWSPDGKSLFYTNTETGTSNIHWRAVVGSGAQQTAIISPRWKETFDVSPDGQHIVVDEQFPDTGEDLMIVSLADQKSSLYVRTPALDLRPAFSPDGKWIAYASYQSGSQEVYVRRFPDTGEQWQVSTGNGTFPKWRHDSKEIFYDDLNGVLMAVPIRTGGTFESDPPRPLFHFDPLVIPEGAESPVEAVTADGTRFLVVTKAEGSTSSPFEVVLRWPELVRGQ
jgi:serine/threonine protein kinase/Tol biopolymer transport system component